MGWQIISVASYNKYADINLLDIDPFQWVAIYGKCQFSLTNRFHGTIFSIKNKIPFVTVESDKRYAYFGTCKTESLLKDLFLDNHFFIYNKLDFTPQLLELKIDEILNSSNFKNLDSNLSKLKNESMQYLVKAKELL